MADQIAQNSFTGGLVQDLSPFNTANTFLTDCLNGTTLTNNGNEYVLQNDMGNRQIGVGVNLPPGYIPTGMVSDNGIIYITSYSPSENKGQVGSIPSTLIMNSEKTIKSEFAYYSKILFDNAEFSSGDEFTIRMICVSPDQRSDKWENLDYNDISEDNYMYKVTKCNIDKDPTSKDYLQQSKYTIRISLVSSGSQKEIYFDSYADIFTEKGLTYKLKYLEKGQVKLEMFRNLPKRSDTNTTAYFVLSNSQLSLLHNILYNCPNNYQGEDSLYYEANLPQSLSIRILDNEQKEKKLIETSVKFGTPEYISWYEKTGFCRYFSMDSIELNDEELAKEIKQACENNSPYMAELTYFKGKDINKCDNLLGFTKTVPINILNQSGNIIIDSYCIDFTNSDYYIIEMNIIMMIEESDEENLPSIKLKLKLRDPQSTIREFNDETIDLPYKSGPATIRFQLPKENWNEAYYELGLSSPFGDIWPQMYLFSQGYKGVLFQDNLFDKKLDTEIIFNPKRQVNISNISLPAKSTRPLEGTGTTGEITAKVQYNYNPSVNSIINGLTFEISQDYQSSDYKKLSVTDIKYSNDQQLYSPIQLYHLTLTFDIKKSGNNFVIESLDEITVDTRYGCGISDSIKNVVLNKTIDFNSNLSAVFDEVITSIINKGSLTDAIFICQCLIRNNSGSKQQINIEFGSSVPDVTGFPEVTLQTADLLNGKSIQILYVREKRDDQNHVGFIRWGDHRFNPQQGSTGSPYDILGAGDENYRRYHNFKDNLTQAWGYLVLRKQKSYYIPASYNIKIPAETITVSNQITYKLFLKNTRVTLVENGNIYKGSGKLAADGKIHYWDNNSHDAFVPLTYPKNMTFTEETISRNYDGLPVIYPSNVNYTSGGNAYYMLGDNEYNQNVPFGCYNIDNVDNGRAFIVVGESENSLKKLSEKDAYFTFEKYPTDRTNQWFAIGIANKKLILDGTNVARDSLCGTN